MKDFFGRGRPLAIAMWDFSWLERRGPGEGFEDWDKAVSELVERGYDAVRIDPYPQLIALSDTGSFALDPVWEACGWGSIKPITVSNVLENLLEFLRVCQKHGVLVGLSGWFRHKESDSYVSKLKMPEDFAQIWIDLLRKIESAGLYDTILYVDFCNEFPNWLDCAPKGENGAPLPRDSAETTAWSNRCIEAFKAVFPQMPVTFSISSEFYRMEREDYGKWDFLEPHIWMNSDGDGRFDFTLRREGRIYDGQDFPRGHGGLEGALRGKPRILEDGAPHADRAFCVVCAQQGHPARHDGVLGDRVLQRMRARLGVDEGALRGRRAGGRENWLLGGDRHEQFLRAAVPRHVGGRRMAPRADRLHTRKSRMKRGSCTAVQLPFFRQILRKSPPVLLFLSLRRSAGQHHCAVSAAVGVSLRAEFFLQAEALLGRHLGIEVDARQKVRRELVELRLFL